MGVYLVTGGSGFIGSALVRHLIESTSHTVINFDKLTYASTLTSTTSVSSNPRYKFVHGDICDLPLVKKIINFYEPDIILHLAAESHVDRSINSPADFVNTNILGTSNLLEAAHSYWLQLATVKKNKFRFHHVSTDEVYGSLGTVGFFDELSPYNPSSPYSASKASSDHLVRAWKKTYGLPVLITNCSNNYGPFQFPEKLIPLIIINALNRNSLPIYGDGQQIRDWLFVDDHVRALCIVAEEGKPGETYNIGGNNEISNLSVVRQICSILDGVKPLNNSASYQQFIKFVEDRPGHDKRYAINANKIQNELGWQPIETFQSGLEKTILWYIANGEWYHEALDSTSKNERAGLSKKL